MVFSGTMAAMSVRRFVADATSRYPNLGRPNVRAGSTSVAATSAAICSVAPATSTSERSEVLAFDDRESCIGHFGAAGEVTAVVGGVELAPEAHVPAGGIAKRRRGEGDRVQDVDVTPRSDIGHRDLLAAQLFEERPRERDGLRVRTAFRQPVQGFSGADAEPTRDRGGASARSWRRAGGT